jgi:F0F1-type ATP synthase membrane subunit b/b'
VERIKKNQDKLNSDARHLLKELEVEVQDMREKCEKGRKVASEVIDLLYEEERKLFQEMGKR